MKIKPGQSYSYNINKKPENMPDNLYLSAFCNTHAQQTTGNLDRYDGKPEDLDPRQGQVKVEDDDFTAILTKEGPKTIKKFSGTGYISGLTGCAHHEDVEVYVEEQGDKRIEQVSYPEQDGMTLRNEMNMKTGDVRFTYMEKPEEEGPKENVLRPGDSYSFNLNEKPDSVPENLYLSMFCNQHTEQTVGYLEKDDNNEKDMDPRVGYVKIEDEDSKYSMTTEGTKVVKDFEGTGYLMGLTGGCHHEDVKVHMEKDGDKIIQRVSYPEQDGMTLQNEINEKTGDIKFTYVS